MSEKEEEEDGLALKYQQKTDKQHILDAPDTYIGSVEEIDSLSWVYDETSHQIIQKQICIVPGLFKLFDECIVNCRDHVMRMQQQIHQQIQNSEPVTSIGISIDEKDGTITMINDGTGIDVAKHPEYDYWIPEMIFGHLRTSTNYNKEEKKIVGGKNGFGIKLVFIWSTFGSIETVDHTRQLKYYQSFESNLDIIHPPVITKSKLKPYTKVTYRPHYERLGLHNGLSSDMISLFRKRVFDIAALTDKTVKVKYNSSLLPVKTFQQYVDLYVSSPKVYEFANDRWEYIVCMTPNDEFSQISFVNGICTSKGGKHVDFILNQIIRKLSDYIELKKKRKVNPSNIKEQLMLFLRCDIENPSFDSQTKDFMNTPSSKFGSRCEVSDKFIEKVAKLGVMENACALSDLKETKAVKKTDGNKVKNIRGIPQLCEANWAGTSKSYLCSFVVTEGISAQTAAISGLSSEDRNCIGIYPLRGKLLNARGETTAKIVANKEISELKKILGLESKKHYTAEDVQRNLRYGNVIFMTDQDKDGSHIKGLAINLFEQEWPSLFHIPGFLGYINTPLIKATKNKIKLEFFNEGEYETWKQSTPDSDSWTIKYYKGLGTSTTEEFREYFKQKKIIKFFSNPVISSDKIDLVFNKKRAHDRKEWLQSSTESSSVLQYSDTNQLTISYEEFVERELKHFSRYDCDRNIPHIMDGLKTSQRKILFCAFKRKLTTEIKVAQFSGYVSENACYHHGEDSLNGAIVGMAQDFVGANNISLLLPVGQFGTRLRGGKEDCASPRYIFTCLNTITRHIFIPADDDILTYLRDDGNLVEPVHYAPIVPMILVNGCRGIGTGFSTNIMCYNLLQIIEYLENKLRYIEQSCVFYPYYHGFQGDIIHDEERKRFLFKGRYERTGANEIRVTELPIGFWTFDFKEHLETLRDLATQVKDFNDMSTENCVHFTISFVPGVLDDLLSSVDEYQFNGLDKLLKLFSSESLNNMHLFNTAGVLTKYSTVEEIIEEYFILRLQMYVDRKQLILQSIELDLKKFQNQINFIDEVTNQTINLIELQNEDDVYELLKTKNYDTFNGDFKYLTDMKLSSLTKHRCQQLRQKFHSQQTLMHETQSKTENDMWLDDLQQLRMAYIQQMKNKEEKDKNNEETDVKEMPRKKPRISKNKNK
jgi:DNA topoisomerase-2